MVTKQAESLVPTDFENFRIIAFSEVEKNWMEDYQSFPSIKLNNTDKY